MIFDDGSQKMGKEAENIFVKTALKNGWKFLRKASTQQDMEEHWDYEFLTTKNIAIKIDVKAHRDTFRNSGKKLKDFYIVEWVNVYGNKGWIEGDAHFIAYEYFGKFYFYKRDKLEQACRPMVNFNKWVKNTEESLYCIYQRKDRLDQISRIRISDLHKKLLPVLTWTI